MPTTRLQERVKASTLRLTSREEEEDEDSPPTSPEPDEPPPLPPTPRLRHTGLSLQSLLYAPPPTFSTLPKRRFPSGSDLTPVRTPPPGPRIVSAPLPRGSPETNPRFHHLMWRAKLEIACSPQDPSPLREAIRPPSSQDSSSSPSPGSSSPVMIEAPEALQRGEHAVDYEEPELGSDDEEAWVEDVGRVTDDRRKWVYLLRDSKDSDSQRGKPRTAIAEARDQPGGSSEPSLSPEQISELDEALSENDLRKFTASAESTTSTSSAVHPPRRSASLSLLPDKPAVEEEEEEEEAELFLRSPVTRLSLVLDPLESDPTSIKPYIGPPRLRPQWAFRNSFHKKLSRAKDDPINPLVATALRSPSIVALSSTRRYWTQRAQGRRRALSTSAIDTYTSGRLGLGWKSPEEFGPGREAYLKRIDDQRKEAEAWRTAQRLGLAEKPPSSPPDPFTPRIRNVEPESDPQESSAGAWLNWQRKDIFARKRTKEGLKDRPRFSPHLSPCWDSDDPLSPFRPVEEPEEEEEEKEEMEENEPEEEEGTEEAARDPDDRIALHTQQLLGVFGSASATWGLGFLLEDENTDVVLKSDSSIYVSPNEGPDSPPSTRLSPSRQYEDLACQNEDVNQTPELDEFGETPPEPVFLTPRLACDAGLTPGGEQDESVDEYVEPSAEDRAASRIRKGKFRACSPSPEASPTWELDETERDKDPDIDFVMATKEAIQRSRTDYQHIPADNLQTPGAGGSESKERELPDEPSTPPGAIIYDREQWEEPSDSIFSLEVEYDASEDVAREDWDPCIQQALWEDVNDSPNSPPEDQVTTTNSTSAPTVDEYLMLPNMAFEEDGEFGPQYTMTRYSPATMPPYEPDPDHDPTSPTFKRQASPGSLPNMPARRRLRFDDEPSAELLGGLAMERDTPPESSLYRSPELELGVDVDLSTPNFGQRSSFRRHSPFEYDDDPPLYTTKSPEPSLDARTTPKKRFSISSLGGPLPPATSSVTSTPVVVCFPPTPRPEPSPVIRKASKRFLSPRSARHVTLDTPQPTLTSEETDRSDDDMDMPRRKSIGHGQERPDLSTLLQDDKDLTIESMNRGRRSPRPRLLKPPLRPAVIYTSKPDLSRSRSFTIDLESGVSPPDSPTDEESRPPQITLNPHISTDLRHPSETNLRSRRREHVMTPEEVEAMFVRFLPPDYDPLARASTTVAFRPTAGPEPVRLVSVPHNTVAREDQDAWVTIGLERMMRNLRWLVLVVVVIIVLVAGVWEGLIFVKMAEGRRQDRPLGKHGKFGRRSWR